MHVAINATILGPAGAATVLRGFLCGWRQLGSAPKLTIYVSKKTIGVDFERDFGIPLTIATVQGWRTVSRPALLRQTQFGKVVDHSGVDVLLTPHLVGNCRVPQVVYHSNINEFETRTWPALARGDVRPAVRHLATTRALRHATANVFQTHFQRLLAEELVPESKPNNHVIWNGANEVIRSDALRTNNLAQLIAIQSASAHKDNPTAIRALQYLCRVRPHVPWRLAIFGSGPWSQHQLLARNLGLESAVHFGGFAARAELDTMLQESLCLVSTSVSESFGLAPIEAMAAGCPVVACNASAIPEVIGEAGVLVTAHDAEGFANAIVHLYDDAAFRTDLIQRGLNRARAFSWPSAASQLTRVLEQASVS